MGRRYGKDALRKLRQHRLDEQRGRLAAAVAATGRASAALGDAESARRRFEVRQRESELEERARLSTGLNHGFDFAVFEAWRQDALEALDGLRAAEVRAKRALAAAMEQEAAASHGLAGAEAELKALEKDYEQWLDAQRSRAERAADEERDEHWISRALASQGQVRA